MLKTNHGLGPAVGSIVALPDNDLIMFRACDYHLEPSGATTLRVDDRVHLKEAQSYWLKRQITTDISCILFMPQENGF